MLGKDVDFDQVIPYVTSPINFHVQQDRKPFTKYGVFGQHTLNENRFVSNEKEYSTMNSKYKGYNSSDFNKLADYSIDEFINIKYGTYGENARDVDYFPKHDLVEPRIPNVRNFEGYSPRKTNFHNNQLTQTSAEPQWVTKGLKSTQKQETKVPFHKQIERDNLYERMHGLPKECKEETVKREAK